MSGFGERGEFGYAPHSVGVTLSSFGRILSGLPLYNILKYIIWISIQLL